MLLRSRPGPRLSDPVGLVIAAPCEALEVTPALLEQAGVRVHHDRPPMVQPAAAAADPAAGDRPAAAGKDVGRADLTRPDVAGGSAPSAGPLGHDDGMKLYADIPVHRARQLVGDLFLVVWVVVWVKVALVVHDATMALAAPGREIASAGDGLAGRLRDAGSAVGGLPLVGSRVRAPFEGAGDAAAQIARAGTAQVAAVQHLAFWLGVAVAAVPILLLALVYLPFRLRFAREATAGQRFIDSTADLHLFALRAMAHQPMHRLARVSDDPVAAWLGGEEDVVRRLAVLELHDVGLSPPAGTERQAAAPTL